MTVDATGTMLVFTHPANPTNRDHETVFSSIDGGAYVTFWVKLSPFVHLFRHRLWLNASRQLRSAPIYCQELIEPAMSDLCPKLDRLQVVATRGAAFN